MKKYIFEDDGGYVWSCTWDQIVEDAKDYEKDSGEIVEDYLQFFLDNFDESIVEFDLVSVPNQPDSPKYRGAVLKEVISE